MGNESSEHPLRDLEPELLGEIVGLLTHDIRNPLAALSSNVGYLGMVGDGLSQDIREAIFDLQLSVEVLARISDAMETVSQELRGLPPAASTCCGFQPLVQAVRPQVERAALSHGVTLHVESIPDARICVAEVAFSKALSNLLHNAISLAPSGTEVRLSVAPTRGGIGFCVEDQGVPLERELWSSAFSAAGQIAVKGKAAGRYTRGLGLYMVGRCARLAGVEVRVREAAPGSAIELVAQLAP